MTTIDHELEQPKKPDGPSMMVTLAICAVISLMAAGSGFGVSAMFLKPAPAPVAAAEPAASETTAPEETGHGQASDHGSAQAETGHSSSGKSLGGDILPLEPVVTNLADPEDAWVRMEVALVFDGGADHGLGEEIHQDIMAYLRTMKLYNLQGGSGYQHLIEDLNSRAATRSEGRVERVLVRTFILE